MVLKFLKIFFTGLNDIDSEGNYTWSDNTTFNVSNWRSNAGEPNNYKGNEDCVEIHWDGKWNDNKCDAEFGFICEKRLGKLLVLFFLSNACIRYVYLVSNQSTIAI